MKKFFALTLVLALIVVGCKKEPETKDSIKLNTETWTASYEGETVNITVTASGDFTAKPDVDWITVSGSAVTVAPNPNYEARTGNVTFTCGEATAKLAVTQEAAPKPKEYTELAGPANSYIVSAAGDYKIKATVMGEGDAGLHSTFPITSTAINPAGATLVWEEVEGLISDVQLKDGYLCFTCANKDGNAVVAATAADGTILWSWLIWATPEVSTYNLEGYTSFMDRNLGAIDVGYCMRGFLYDWGRKDAFSAANGGYDVYPYVPVASSVFTHSTGPSTMAYAVAHHTDYVIGPSSYYTWMENTECAAKPWRTDVKTIYDPCPAGWRIPIKDEISNIGGLPATGLTEGYDAGYYYKGFGNPGTGYYWTSSTDEGGDQRAYAFCNDGRNINHWGQDQGYAIRPVLLQD